MIEVTEVRVSPFHKDRLRAFAQITLNNSFVVKNLKVIETDEGLFVSMPSRKREGPDGLEHVDICHPVDKPTRELIEDAILDEYERTT